MKRGVALLWSLILIIILLITSGVMVTYIVKESQSTVRIEESTRAYAAAKSGVEWAQFHILGNPNPPYATKTLNIDEGVTAVVTIEKNINPNTSLPFYKITSIGTDGTVRRAIEHIDSDFDYSQVFSSTNPIPPDTTVLSANNNDSFTMLFDFWIENASTQWLFGASTASRDSYIALVNNGSNFAVRVKKPGLSSYDVVLNNPDTPTPSEVIGQGRMLRAELRYINGIGLSVRLIGHFDDEGRCLVATSIPIKEEMNNLNQLYTNGMIFDATIVGAVQPTNAAFFQNLYFKN